jgi:hypothetical protein
MLGLELEISYQIGVHRDRGRIWGISHVQFPRRHHVDGFPDGRVWDGEILSLGDIDFVFLFR